MNLSVLFGTEGLAIANSQSLTITHDNRMFHVSLGHPESLVSQSLLDVIPHFNPEKLRATLDSLAAAYSTEGEVVSLQGRRSVLRFVIQKVSIEGKDELGIRIVNITDTRKEALLRVAVEKLVQTNRERAQEAQRNFKAILDALPQGFLTVDADGVVNQDYSIRVAGIFDGPIVGKDFWKEIVGCPTARETVDIAFAGGDWDAVTQLLPRRISYKGKTVELKFVPVYLDSKLTAVLVACEDISETQTLRELAENQLQQAKLVFAILSEKEEFLDLLDLVSSLKEVAGDGTAFRSKVHTIKSVFSLFECRNLAEKCHEAESSWLQEGYSIEAGECFADELSESVEHFLSDYEHILPLSVNKESRQRLYIQTEKVARLATSIQDSDSPPTVKSRLLDQVEESISVPVSEALGWLEPLWQRSLRGVYKQGVPIVWRASDLIVKEPYTELFQTFSHLVRNAAVHGIELPKLRDVRGKPTQGTLTIESRVTTTELIIFVSDDGGGIDTALLRRAAASRTLGDLNALSDAEILELLFTPEFSLSETTTELSGRGFGLHAVRESARALGGDVTVQTFIGSGTRFEIRVPKRSLWRATAGRLGS